MQNYNNVENIHLFEVKYLGATNNKGSRVKIVSTRFEQSTILPLDYQYNSILEQAVNYLIGRGYILVGKGETKNGYFIVSSTFESLK